MIIRLISVFETSGFILLTLLPYVLFGVILAEILKYTPWTRFVRGAVGRSPGLAIIFASILGIISPLCTYGSVPIVRNLHKSGIPLAPLVTFLSASSLMNPQLFLISWGGLGSAMAVIRLGGVIVFTFGLGFVLLLLGRNRRTAPVPIGPGKFTRTTSTEKSFREFDTRDFIRSSLGNLEFIGFWIVTGVLISTLLEEFVPVSWILSTADQNEWISVSAASILGIPLYACGGGTIPLVDMFISNGMSYGAAAAFLIVGPATRITPLLALRSFMKPRMITSYVAALLLFSIVSGIIINRGLAI